MKKAMKATAKSESAEGMTVALAELPPERNVHLAKSISICPKN